VRHIVVLLGILGASLASTSASAKVKKPLVTEREEVAAPVVAAAFDPDEAARQIRAHMSGVRACYERVSRADSSLHGKLQIGFDVGDSGQVAATQIEVNGLRVDADWATTSQLAGCIRGQALGWRLSPEGSAGGAHVSFVFVFEAAQASR
jgi:hypothetical protein